jgi:hypothetical protein
MPRAIQDRVHSGPCSAFGRVALQWELAPQRRLRRASHSVRPQRRPSCWFGRHALAAGHADALSSTLPSAAIAGCVLSVLLLLGGRRAAGRADAPHAQPASACRPAGSRRGASRMTSRAIPVRGARDRVSGCRLAARYAPCATSDAVSLHGVGRNLLFVQPLRLSRLTLVEYSRSDTQDIRVLPAFETEKTKSDTS